MKRTILTALAIMAAGPAVAQVAAPGPTLSAIQARDSVVCGAHPGAPGFNVLDSRGVHRGLDADTCRAIAAAALGDGNKARWVVLSSQARLPALQSGQIDVLPRTTTWTRWISPRSGRVWSAGS